RPAYASVPYTTLFRSLHAVRDSLVPELARPVAHRQPVLEVRAEVPEGRERGITVAARVLVARRALPDPGEIRGAVGHARRRRVEDRKSTRLNSSHVKI